LTGNKIETLDISPLIWISNIKILIDPEVEIINLEPSKTTIKKTEEHIIFCSHNKLLAEEHEA